MIELLTADTPNGKKISIMLEEIKLDYKVTKINIFKDEQFKPEFKKLSPFSKIPVIIDHDNNQSLFESGAILISSSIIDIFLPLGVLAVKSSIIFFQVFPEYFWKT